MSTAADTLAGKRRNLGTNFWVVLLIVAGIWMIRRG